MKKNIAIVVLVIALIVVGGLLITEKYSNNKVDTMNDLVDDSGQNTESGNSAGSETSNPETESNTSGTDGTDAITRYLYIQDFKYYAQITTIRVGDTVVWENNDNTKHTVTSDSGTELNSE